jgi:hypothetical protein
MAGNKNFQIKNDKLIYPTIFPGNKANIFVEFDIHEFDDQQTIPSIKIKEDGRKVLVPQTTNNEGFPGKYQILNLKGDYYKVQ